MVSSDHEGGHPSDTNQEYNSGHNSYNNLKTVGIEGVEKEQMEIYTLYNKILSTKFN